MESDSYKLLGSPVGHHGPYSFYKALKVTKTKQELILAIGDFFFVKLWQDSELMAIGELQLLWTDRTNNKTLVSLRLYFLPENTPAGRAHHGEDEVVGISERVVLHAEDLPSWVCTGAGWRWGLKAAWADQPAAAATSDKQETPEPIQVTQANSKIDLTDVDKEKKLIEDEYRSCVVVFSYPRYCRYRAMLRRLEGLADSWMRDPVVLALGGYAAPSRDTRILYCRETFEYPELEGHEFVVNHLSPRLKSRASKAGRRRRARSAERSSGSESDASRASPSTTQPTRSSLRIANPASPSLSLSSVSVGAAARAEDRAFMQRLRLFHRAGGAALPARISGLACKDLNLSQLYTTVVGAGGYEAVTRARSWRRLLSNLGGTSTSSQAALARRHYERLLLPFERSEKRTSTTTNGTSGSSNFNTPTKPDRKKMATNLSNSVPTAIIDISDSPVRETPPKKVNDTENKGAVPRLRTPPPGKRKSLEPKKLNLQNGNIMSDDKKKVKNCGDIINLDEEQHKHGSDGDQDKKQEEDNEADITPENHFDPSNILNLEIGKVDSGDDKENGKDLDNHDDYVRVTKAADELNQEFLDSLPATIVKEGENNRHQRTTISVVPPEKLMGNIDKTTPTRSRPSSLRSVRVKPDRGRQTGASSSSPPASSTPIPPTITASLMQIPPPSQSTGPPSDDDLIEVPYKPKSPEIIDLDLYESPESPQSAKRKKLDILKRGGLEVTAVGAWPGLDPVFQQQILNQAQIFHMYNTFPNANATESVTPPKVTQAKSIYGSSSPQKTVYGNPKELFMPPPHILQGVAPRKVNHLQKNIALGPDILDLTVKPAVEIVRVANSNSNDQPQNLSAKKPVERSLNSALEITLVAARNNTTCSSSSNSTNSNNNSLNSKSRAPQKRSSSGKFMSNKNQSYLNSLAQAASQPSRNNQKSSSNNLNSLVIPQYQVSSTNNLGSNNVNTNNFNGLNTNNLVSSMAQSLLQSGGGLLPSVDPSLYMTALYSTLAGQLGVSDAQHTQQLALYRELLAGGLLGKYGQSLQDHSSPTNKS